MRQITDTVLLSLTVVLLSACSKDIQAQRQQAADQSHASIRAALPDFSQLVDNYGDAVVYVEVVQKRQRTGQALTPEDPMFDFFRRFGIPLPDTPQQGAPPAARGSGSGFIVSPDGHILTNAHVVADADEVTVRLTDRREFSAKVIGSDARTDVAVLKVDAERLPVVQIGDPAGLKAGQWVLAIGSPFGLENSATAGIVSATSRAVGGESYVPFIQTDVAVNPGNSGGPLFNLDGEVVGINSMIFSRSGGYMGLSFAIPIDVAIDVRDQLIKTGRVTRGRIGVVVQDVDAQLARSFGLDRPRGALVSQVSEDGPGDRAGLKAGDIILGVNGRDVERFNDLSRAISGMQPGVEARLRLWRDRKEREVTVEVEEMRDAAGTRTGGPGGGAGAAEQLGMTVRPLAAPEKQRLQTQGSLVVEQVEEPAASAGVRSGDVILGVSNRRIQDVKELRAAIKEAQGNVALLVQRGTAQIYIAIPVE